MPDDLIIPEQNKRPPRPSSSETGAKGERLAAEFLTRNGYRVVMANFTVPIGRNANGAQVSGEIDLIALDGEILCFVEVKTRRDIEFTGPLANVNLRKQRVITRTSRVYRRVFAVHHLKYRFDVVTVIDDGHSEPEIELYKGYWNESKFRKRSWTDERF